MLTQQPTRIEFTSADDFASTFGGGLGSLRTHQILHRGVRNGTGLDLPPTSFFPSLEIETDPFSRPLPGCFVLPFSTRSRPRTPFRSSVVTATNRSSCSCGHTGTKNSETVKWKESRKCSMFLVRCDDSLQRSSLPTWMRPGPGRLPVSPSSQCRLQYKDGKEL